MPRPGLRVGARGLGPEAEEACSWSQGWARPGTGPAYLGMFSLTVAHP